ncbi:MAG: hypothetical protein GY785_03170 [Gammaproteobacteria bacterium]|nr:hypothetical protein [Gammaproteobacteria bacterium]
MNHRITCFLVLASLLPGAALAQSEASTEEEVIPRYDVEVIVFKNIKTPKSKEFVLPVSSPGQDEAMFDLSSAASVEAARDSGYELLAATEYRLLEVVSRLIDSSRYQLLLHAAWRQPGLERQQVLPVWLKGGRIYGNEYTSIDNQIEFIDDDSQVEESENSETKTYGFDEQTLESLELQLLEQQDMQSHGGLYEFEGKITIALSRYLHTYADLILRRPRLSVDPVLGNTPQNTYLAANAADTRILNNHPIKEHRRMRSKNLHYLDHPEYAMLILITPYEVADDFEEEVIETEIEAEPAAAE